MGRILGGATGRPTVLDRTPNSVKAAIAAEPAAGESSRAESGSLRRVRDLLRVGWQFFVRQCFSSLTRRIIFLNLVGLVALVAGILYLNQFRAGLIDARVQSLLIQGEIIAGAIAASATVDSDTIAFDPDKLLELQAGQSTVHPTSCCRASNSRSIRSRSRRCCAASSRRPTPAPASMTATARWSSTAAISIRTCCASTCRRRQTRPGILERF